VDVKAAHKMLMKLTPEVPGHVVGRHDDDDKEYGVAQVEDGQVHAIGGNGALVDVVEHLQDVKNML
jgi:hypothetical protein